MLDFAIYVFIDFKKEFDTVDLSFVLSKFEFYEIRGVSHEWLTS